MKIGDTCPFTHRYLKHPQLVIFSIFLKKDLNVNFIVCVVFSFLENLSRVAQNGYVPTFQDILCVRKPTIGVHEQTFVVKKISYRYETSGPFETSGSSRM